ncbi:MAG: AbrB/MazE/SpoVT family DNA-binding domain-containing protein [Candidatus Eisenbacteria bacterium]
MAAVTLSTKYQIVIPKQVRDQLKLAPGQVVEVVVHGDRIELIPQRPMKQMRGFLRGIDSRVQREKDRP